MKVISFCGFKGGTGKTTLAVNCCRYLYYYEQHKVSMLHFDPHQVLSSLAVTQACPFNIEAIKFGEIDEELLGNYEYHDFLIVDCPSAFSAEYLPMLQLVDVIIVPFLYTVLDYYKLLAFGQVLAKLGIDFKKVVLLPNFYSERLCKDSQTEKLIKGAPMLGNLRVMPGIPRNKPMANLQLGNLVPTELNNIRPAFIKIIHILDILTSNI